MTTMAEIPEIKILLLEDSPSDARLLQQELKEVQDTRFSVTWVESLAGAIGKLGKRTFDVGLLDLTVPDSTGSATFKTILEAYPALPIVVLTGATDETVGIEAIRMGVQDYLAKGSTGGKSMARVIRYAIERKHSEVALRRSIERFELLAHTASELLQSKDPLKTVESLCTKVMHHLDCHAFFNFLFDEKAGKLHLNACAGVPDEEKTKLEWLDLGVAVCGCVARDGVRIVAEHIPATPDPRTDLVKSFGIKAYACHPLIGDSGRPIGTISFGTRSRETFGAEDLSLMKAVADQVAIAMTRMKNEEDLRTSRAAALNLMDDALEAKNRAEYTSARLQESRKKIEELNVFLKRRAVELSSSYTELQRITQLLSRDLRVPLRVVSGYCQLLLDEYRDKMDASGSEYITLLDRGVQQVNALLDDVLLLSGISRKQMWLQSVNLSVLAKEVVEELQKSEPAHKVEIIIQDNVVEWADRGFMKQVLQSLLENAWKYTFRRERPKIEFGALNGQKPQVCFVRDNGTGFDIQDAQDIFTPFRRLVPDNDFATAGAGLAIVERIIQRHGGKVWAEGEKDKGAVFYFNLG